MDQLNSLFSTLVIYRHNIHILHWKVKGSHFDCTHKLFDDYVDKFNDFIDEVAEVMLMEGMNPLCLHGCIETASNDVHKHVLVSPEKDYDEEDCMKLIQVMFDTLITMYTRIDEEHILSSGLQSKFDEHICWLRLECNYKNKQRLK